MIYIKTIKFFYPYCLGVVGVMGSVEIFPSDAVRKNIVSSWWKRSFESSADSLTDSEVSDAEDSSTLKNKNHSQICYYRKFIKLDFGQLFILFCFMAMCTLNSYFICYLMHLPI